jgi:hypothetical protein
MKRMMKIGVGLALAVSLCACGPEGMLKSTQTGYISNVNVTLAKPMGSPQLAETIRTRTMAEAGRYQAKGEPKTLQITVLDLHKKNPAMSFLVGDANWMQTKIVLVDDKTGAEHGRVDHRAFDNAMINGVIGAAMAAAQSQDQVEDALTDKVASDALVHVYGTEVAKVARKNPRTPIPAAPAAPAVPASQPSAPVAKPAKPKETPVALAPTAPQKLAAAY